MPAAYPSRPLVRYVRRLLTLVFAKWVGRRGDTVGTVSVLKLCRTAPWDSTQIRAHRLRQSLLKPPVVLPPFLFRASSFACSTSACASPPASLAGSRASLPPPRPAHSPDRYRSGRR